LLETTNQRCKELHKEADSLETLSSRRGKAKSRDSEILDRQRMYIRK
jgi:ribosomal protein L17